MKIRKITISMLLAGLCCGFLLFVTCKKDRIEDKPLNEYKSLKEYLNSKKQQEQEFIIDTPGKCPIIGKLGTHICPSKSAIMFQDKSDSITYPYIIKLVELYSPKDIIYYQMPSVGGGSILTTAGEIRLRAFKDSSELLFRPSKSWSISMPSKATVDGMKQYYGVATDSSSNWTMNPVGDFGKNDTSYFALIQKLGWIACAKDASNASSVTISVASLTDNLANVGVFVYIPSTKTVLQIRNLVSEKIPTGLDVKVLAFAQNASNDLFYYYKELTLGQNNELLDISLKKISDADLIAKLDAL